MVEWKWLAIRFVVKKRSPSYNKINDPSKDLNNGKLFQKT
jgi:hypothetical protein